MEGPQRSPEDASAPTEDQELSNAAVCAFVSPSISLGMPSKRSHSLHLLMCDSVPNAIEASASASSPGNL